MSSPKSYRTVEIMQYCSYGFTPEYVSGRICNWAPVKDYAFITHDKDVKSDGTPKDPHIHCMIRFKHTVAAVDIVKRLDGVCRNEHLQKMQKWSSALAYLCHDNRPNEFQYDHSLVISNFDWEAEAAEVKSSSNRLKEIIDMIDSGEITPFNVYDKISTWEYSKYRVKINDALRFVGVRESDGNRQMECIYICGEAGASKTVYAKEIAKGRFGSRGFYISASGKDPLSDYVNQPCIILDDLRPENFDDSSEILKLLDNNTDAPVKSRYFNKLISNCKLIIITSIYEPVTFFKRLTISEDLWQIKRRIGLYIFMTRDEIKLHYSSKQVHDFVHYKTIPNAYYALYSRDFGSEVELQNYVSDVLGSCAEAFKFAPTIAHDVSSNDDFEHQSFCDKHHVDDNLPEDKFFPHDEQLDF